MVIVYIDFIKYVASQHSGQTSRYHLFVLNHQYKMYQVQWCMRNFCFFIIQHLKPGCHLRSSLSDEFQCLLYETDSLQCAGLFQIESFQQRGHLSILWSHVTGLCYWKCQIYGSCLSNKCINCIQYSQKKNTIYVYTRYNKTATDVLWIALLDVHGSVCMFDDCVATVLTISLIL